MDQVDFLKKIAKETPSKIVYLIADGIGGCPGGAEGKTELEAAKTPNLDKLAARSSLGLSTPIMPGVTPGSGPAHLALFGYDPVKYEIARGALSAAGVGFKQTHDDLAARVNFATVDSGGCVTDRRAGRIPTELCKKLCEKIQACIKIPDTEVFVLPEKEHRAVAIFRKKGLCDQLSDTDPQQTGVPPMPVKALSAEAEETAALVAAFLKQVAKILSDEKPANMILMRGFAHHPDIASMNELYKLKTCAIATYPMYKGLAHLVGMQVIDGLSTTEDEIKALRDRYNDFSFFYFHFKKTDSRGEDGNFEEKVKAIEEVDNIIPSILDLKPECLVVTGDHSTPSLLASHSWHPVPFLLASPTARRDGVETFNERTCAGGSLGVFYAVHALPLAMGHALKLEKFGA